MADESKMIDEDGRERARCLATQGKESNGKKEVEGRLERLQTKLFYPSYLGTILHADLIS